MFMTDDTRMRKFPPWWAVLLLFPWMATAAENSADALWKAHIQPLFSQHCFKCHGELKQKNGLDLTSPAAILKGGEGGPALIPGKPEESLVYKFVQPGAELHMPPKDYQLSGDELSLLKMWIASFPGTGTVTGPVPTNTTSTWSESDYALGKPNAPRKLPPNGLTVSEGVDWYIQQEWPRLAATLGKKSRPIKPTPRVDDRTFVRRIYLDLVGRIPSAEEAETFIKNRHRDRREQLVDRLLTSGEHARYFAEVLDVVLMGKRSGDGDWKRYLESAVQTNRSWDRVVRELLLARPEDSAGRGAVRYLYSRKDNHQAVAEAAAPGLFGVQVQCAQCHNHPLAPEIKQSHYWGLVTFFNRSKNVDTSDGPAVSESAIGGFVKFANLKKESQDARMVFLDGRSIDEKRPEDNEKESDAPEKYRVAPVSGRKLATIPKFSRREQLANLATQENPLLSRAVVNRIWALLMGRGLVHPVDRMDSAHPASHPDLLQWLARDFEHNGYDVRRLTKLLVLTRTYQRSAPGSGREAPLPESFAAALEKPIPGEALWRSMVLAAGLTHAPSDNSLVKGREKFAEVFPELFSVDYAASLKQALFLSNNSMLEDAVKPEAGGTAARLLALSSPRERAREAFVLVLGREPDTAERKRAEEYLAARGNDRQAIGELLWALLASAEFRFTP
jgi:mono/diheme cytochrome c family protein